jgi:membrane protease subunit (stomatin/prohibitin family)
MGPRGRRARRRGLIVGGVVGASVAKSSASKQAAAQQQAQAAATPAPSGMATQLQELQNLKDQGILTEEEFQAKKKQILGI